MIVLGLGSGLSSFFFGYYDSTAWVWIGLAVLVVALAGVLGRPPRLTLPIGLAVGGLAGLGLWTLISSQWAETTDAAVVNGNRLIVLAAVLGVAVTLVTSEFRAAVLLSAIAVGALAVAASILVRLLGHDPITLLDGGRLTAPLDYPNGQGCALALGLWPCVALAEDRRAPLAGAGAAATTLLACLIVLTQSRSTAAGLLIACLITVAVVPRRIRRTFLLLLVVAVVVVSWHTLLGLYHAASANQSVLAPAHDAARVAILTALGMGVFWTVVVSIESKLSARSTVASRRLQILGTGALLALVVAGGAVIAVKAGSIGHQVHVQYESFVNSRENVGSPSAALGRLASGGGSRYALWREAWKAFLRHPIIGLGGGGWEPDWYARRAIAADVHQPHSFELQALSETGIIGGIAVLLFIAGAGIGAWRMRRAAAESQLSRGCMVAALGGATCWLVQTSVDWIHLLPGVTAAGLAMIAVLVRDRRPLAARGPAPDRSRADPGTRRLLGRDAAAVVPTAVIALLVVLASASLARQGLSDRYRADGQTALAANNPASALSDANKSLRIDPDAIRTYYLRATALARFNLPIAAEATMHEALRREPRNWVTWALLGDLEVRAQHLRLASAAYEQAFKLNPLDTTLRAAARNPRVAAQAASG